MADISLKLSSSSVSLSDCSFYYWSSKYEDAANIQSSNVTLCGNVVFQNIRTILVIMEERCTLMKVV